MRTTQELVRNNIEVLGTRHDNAIPIFGGALWVYDGNDFDLDRFMSGLPHIVHSAKFFKWHEGVVGAIRRYCNICMVDPMLVEVALGMRLEDIYAV